MTKADEYIDLTSALSLVAFGIEVTGDAFARAMNVEHFGIGRAEAVEKFRNGLERLQQAVLAGNLELVGQYRAGDQASSTGLSEPIPAQKLHDFVAFDYTQNGLRHGELQVLWFAHDDQGYTQPTFTRKEYFRDIKVMRGQIRKFLGTGKSPAQQARNKPSLSEADLQKWYRALTSTDRGLPIETLVKLAKESHPGHHVPRQAVRRVVGSRPRGRPRKSAT